MEVRPSQRASTIAQALAHNASTLDRDLDMFIEVLSVRKDFETLASVQAAQAEVHRAYANLLEIFGEEVAGEVADSDGHLPADDHGHERTFVGQAHHDAGLARRFETR
jgi:hypothetical protein